MTKEEKRKYDIEYRKKNHEKIIEKRRLAHRDIAEIDKWVEAQIFLARTNDLY